VAEASRDAAGAHDLGDAICDFIQPGASGLDLQGVLVGLHSEHATRWPRRFPPLHVEDLNGRAAAIETVVGVAAGALLASARTEEGRHDGFPRRRTL